MTNAYITNEQRAEWDKVVWNGLITVAGPAAYEYFCNKLTQRLCDGGDPRTWAVLGSKDEQVVLLKKILELGGTTSPDGEPELVCVSERIGNDGESYPSSCTSEDDVENVADFMRNSTARGYWPIGGVILLGEGEDLKYVDRLLKVPHLMNGVTRFIEVPVMVVNDTDGWSDFSKETSNTPSGIRSTVEVVWGHQIVPESVRFMVPEFIPLHQATAFSGEMDTRKSTLALDIAAAGSMWRPWFTGEENQHKPFITLFAGAEDDFATTVVPRFMAAGGNRDCLGGLKLDVKCEQHTNDGLKEYTTPLSFDAHLNHLSETILSINKTREWKVGLLINDPIISFFGNKNYNNSQDSRDIMRGLKQLCDELHLTIINICHFNKTQGLTAKQKTAGSKALIEAHRQAWAFDLMEGDKSTTLIAPIKHNLLKDARSYRITTDSKEIEWAVGGGYYQNAEVGVVRFVGYSNMTADERIEEKESKDRGSRKSIKAAILDVLKDGPKPAGHVCNELRDMGSVSSLRRAAQNLEEEGKLRRSGNNNRNMTWELATEVEQGQIFQGAANND